MVYVMQCFEFFTCVKNMQIKKINTYVEDLIKQISTIENCRLVIASLIRGDMEVLKHN
jgi:hypothetical protein